MTHFLAKIYFSLIRVLKIKKKKLALTFLYCLGEENDWIIHENLFTSTNQDSTISFRWEN